MHLMAMERIFNYGIFETQVKLLIKNISKHYESRIKLIFCAIIPLVHISSIGIELNFIKYRLQMKKLKKELKKYNIETIVIFVPLFRWTIYVKYYFMPLFLLTALPMVYYIVVKNKIDIVHCRSYLPTFLTILIKKINLKTKVLFDTRAPLPEQGIVAGRYINKSIEYKMWKKIESCCMRNSDVVVLVTDELLEDIKNIIR